MTGPGAREAGDANRLGGNRRRGPVITARWCHVLGCRVLGPGVYLSYSSSSPSPQNENWVRWSKHLAGPQQNAGGTMSMDIHSWAMEEVLVIVTQTWGWPRVNPDEVDHRDNLANQGPGH